jgi:O-antigen/teichoic acid export membrane protein
MAGMSKLAQSSQKDNALETVVKGGGFQFAGQLFSAGIAFAVSLVVIRYLPREQYGLVTLVYSFTHVLTFVALLGLKSGMPRYIAAARGQGGGANLGQLVTLLLPLVLLLAVIASFSWCD